MFNKDFYPTPKSVYDLLKQNGLNVLNKVIAEPSAGKCNLVRYMKDDGAKEVLTCEIEPELQHICRAESTFVNDDFLQTSKENWLDIDIIVMNPPFSSQNKHIKHAVKSLPTNSELYTICNYDSIKNTQDRYITTLISGKLAGSIELIELGEVFAESERKTRVNAGLLIYRMPFMLDEKTFNFDDFLNIEEEEHQENGIMKYDAVREIVQRYCHSVRAFTELQKNLESINDLTKPLGARIDFENDTRTMGMDTTTIDTYVLSLQRAAWRAVFGKLGMDKLMTSDVRKDFNTFIKKQGEVKFTMRNIYAVVEQLYNQSDGIVNKAIENSIDYITWRSYACSGQGIGLEKWKTNSHYKLGKKFILDRFLKDTGYSSCDACDIIDDIFKAISLCEGTKPPETTHNWWDCRKMNTGEWYEMNEYCEAKVFKKGTIHVRFTDLDILRRVNKRYGEIKGKVLVNYTDKK